MCDSKKEYRKRMFGAESIDERKAEAALERAHDIRKFEIDLLWRRAAYAATLQAFLFAALGVSFSADNTEFEPIVYVLRLIVCAVGAFSSLFWYFINKGSRFWSQNWEKHIDFLEDEFEGKLYKTVLSDDGYKSYSVSRVNISISIMFLSTWLVLAGILLSHAIIKLFDCVASQFCCMKTSTVIETIVGFIGFAVLVALCLKCCRNLRTQFDGVDKGGNKAADAFFVKRRLPDKIDDSPLDGMSIWQEIWHHSQRKKSS